MVLIAALVRNHELLSVNEQLDRMRPRSQVELRVYTCVEVPSMNSQWIKRLNTARGWILGVGALAVAVGWFLRQ
jgi:hypothetical protein